MSACPQELGSCHPQRLLPIVVGHDVRGTSSSGGGPLPTSTRTDAVVVEGGGGRGDDTTMIHPPLCHEISFPIENSSTMAGNVDIVVAIAIAVDPLLPLHHTHLSSI
jgi:hypothetical protein